MATLKLKARTTPVLRKKRPFIIDFLGVRISPDPLPATPGLSNLAPSITKLFASAAELRAIAITKQTLDAATCEFFARDQQLPATHFYDNTSFCASAWRIEREKGLILDSITETYATLNDDPDADFHVATLLAVRTANEIVYWYSPGFRFSHHDTHQRAAFYRLSLDEENAHYTIEAESHRAKTVLSELVQTYANKQYRSRY